MYCIQIPVKMLSGNGATLAFARLCPLNEYTHSIKLLQSVFQIYCKTLANFCCGCSLDFHFLKVTTHKMLGKC